MIFVTLGTMFMDFPRLIDKMDHIAHESGEEVILQLGLYTCQPKHCTTFDFKPHAELLDLQRDARVIVAHAGIGATRDALALAKPLILVPRRKHFGEHMNDHQLEIADAVARRGWGAVVHDIDEIDALLANPPAPVANYTPDKARLITTLRTSVEALATRRAS